MSLWGLPFFGLTHVKKADLFLEEISGMMEIYSETFSSAMMIPVPYRKWLIKRWNKRREDEKSANGAPDVNQPLSPAERINMIRQQQKADGSLNSNASQQGADFFSGQKK